MALSIGALIGSGTAQGTEALMSRRPITIVVPFAASGIGSSMARLIGDGIAAELGTTVVVENRPGANGIVGIRSVAKAAPDGHTLLYAITGVEQNKALYNKVPYHPFTDFQPISLIELSPVAFVVGANSAAKSIDEFAAAARVTPASLGSNGVGSTPHLFDQLLSASRRLDMTHVARPRHYTGPTSADIQSVSWTAAFDWSGIEQRGHSRVCCRHGTLEHSTLAGSP